MTANILFSANAFERYYVWCGIPSDDAEAMAVGSHHALKSPHPLLPERADGKGPHSAESFFRVMTEGFGAHLASKGIDTEPFFCEDPYRGLGSGGSEAPETVRASGGSPVVIGFTGGRRCGKSFVSGAFEDQGFVKVHPFNPGKAFLRGYYVARGASENEAVMMTDGVPPAMKDVPGWEDLKDRPAPRDVLPVNPETGENYTSRLLMEELGWFMANVVGLDSTIGRDLQHWAGAGNERIIVDSVVYEADMIRRYENAVILRIEAPGSESMSAHIKADLTDRNVSMIEPDGVIVNRMSGMEDLRDEVWSVLSGLANGREPIVRVADGFSRDAPSPA